jgi:hypothetical protein
MYVAMKNGTDWRFRRNDYVTKNIGDINVMISSCDLTHAMKVVITECLLNFHPSSRHRTWVDAGKVQVNRDSYHEIGKPLLVDTPIQSLVVVQVRFAEIVWRVLLERRGGRFYHHCEEDDPSRK